MEFSFLGRGGTRCFPWGTHLSIPHGQGSLALPLHTVALRGAWLRAGSCLLSPAIAPSLPPPSRGRGLPLFPCLWGEPGLAEGGVAVGSSQFGPLPKKKLGHGLPKSGSSSDGAQRPLCHSQALGTAPGGCPLRVRVTGAGDRAPLAAGVPCAVLLVWCRRRWGHPQGGGDVSPRLRGARHRLVTRGGLRRPQISLG